MPPVGRQSDARLTRPKNGLTRAGLLMEVADQPDGGWGTNFYGSRVMLCNRVDSFRLARHLGVSAIRFTNADLSTNRVPLCKEQTASRRSVKNREVRDLHY